MNVTNEETTMLARGPGSGRRTSVITGGTGGIGRAVAVRLARRGHRVLIVGRSVSRGSAVLTELEDANPAGGHPLIQADLGLLRDTARAAGEIAERTDRMDAVVLCAGCRCPGRTQFANDVLAVELAERVRGSRIDVTCTYPGLVGTDVFRNARVCPGLCGRRPWRCSACSQHHRRRRRRRRVFLAEDPAAVGLGGSFFGARRRQLRVPERVPRRDRRAAVWGGKRRPDPTMAGRPRLGITRC